MYGGVAWVFLQGLSPYMLRTVARNEMESGFEKGT